MSDFQDRKVLITGGTTGIGYATAEAFIRNGATVAITGVNAERLQAATERLGDKCLGILADTSQVSTAKDIAARCKSRLGHLDVLVANAGICLMNGIDVLSEEDFDREMAINFKGAVFTIQACLPLLKPGASILATNSVNDVKGVPGQLVYSASKAALRSMVRTLAAELAPRQIRVNAVAAGPIDTPIFDKLAATPAKADQARTAEANLTAMKRLGRPEEIAAAFLFLASDHAHYITGANLRVDSGWADL